MTEESGLVEGPEDRPPTYMMLSILATIFLCFPTGLVAVFYSFGVNPAYDAGDVAKAEQLSASARQWAFFSIIGAIVAVLFGGIGYYWWWA